jgi:hypothetical protein
MRRVTSILLLAGLVATAAQAQSAAGGEPLPAAEEAAASTAGGKRLTITTGADLPTAYMFRGILQEDRGVIFQPPVDLGIALYGGSGALTGISANVGTWGSVHSGPSGSDLHANSLYETDYYGSVTFAFGRFKPGALFTSYTSPGDAFSTVNELAAVMAFDDSASRFPLSPKAIIAFELSGQADGGDRKGTYLELGIRPGVKLAPALSIGFPVKFGLSLADYYEGPAGSDTFGYADTGAIASVPLPATGKAAWELHGGVDFLWLGDNLTRLNGGDGFKPVGTVGFTVTY